MSSRSPCHRTERENALAGEGSTACVNSKHRLHTREHAFGFPGNKVFNEPLYSCVRSRQRMVQRIPEQVKTAAYTSCRVSLRGFAQRRPVQRPFIPRVRFCYSATVATVARRSIRDRSLKIRVLVVIRAQMKPLKRQLRGGENVLWLILIYE